MIKLVLFSVTAFYFLCLTILKVNLSINFKLSQETNVERHYQYIEINQVFGFVFDKFFNEILLIKFNVMSIIQDGI